MQSPERVWTFGFNMPVVSARLDGFLLKDHFSFSVSGLERQKSVSGAAGQFADTFSYSRLFLTFKLFQNEVNLIAHCRVNLFGFLEIRLRPFFVLHLFIEHGPAIVVLAVLWLK